MPCAQIADDTIWNAWPVPVNTSHQAPFRNRWRYNGRFLHHVQGSLCPGFKSHKNRVNTVRNKRASRSIIPSTPAKTMFTSPCSRCPRVFTLPAETPLSQMDRIMEIHSDVCPQTIRYVLEVLSRAVHLPYHNTVMKCHFGLVIIHQPREQATSNRLPTQK
jgi:hypothetical protein